MFIIGGKIFTGGTIRERGVVRLSNLGEMERVVGVEVSTSGDGLDRRVHAMEHVGRLNPIGRLADWTEQK